MTDFCKKYQEYYIEAGYRRSDGGGRNQPGGGGGVVEGGRQFLARRFEGSILVQSVLKRCKDSMLWFRSSSLAETQTKGVCAPWTH